MNNCHPRMLRYKGNWNTRFDIIEIDFYCNPATQIEKYILCIILWHPRQDHDHLRVHICPATLTINHYLSLLLFLNNIPTRWRNSPSTIYLYIKSNGMQFVNHSLCKGSFTPSYFLSNIIISGEVSKSVKYFVFISLQSTASYDLVLHSLFLAIRATHFHGYDGWCSVLECDRITISVTLE